MMQKMWLCCVCALAADTDAAAETAVSVELDIEPTTLLSADHWRAKMNVRPANKRAPTQAHLRLGQFAADPADLGDRSIAGIDDKPPVVVHVCCSHAVYICVLVSVRVVNPQDSPNNSSSYINDNNVY